MRGKAFFGGERGWEDVAGIEVEASREPGLGDALGAEFAAEIECPVEALSEYAAEE